MFTDDADKIVIRTARNESIITTFFYCSFMSYSLILILSRNLARSFKSFQIVLRTQHALVVVLTCCMIYVHRFLITHYIALKKLL